MSPSYIFADILYLAVFATWDLCALLTLPLVMPEGSFIPTVTVTKVLFTVCYTKKQITALNFFAITKTITKIAGNGRIL